MSIFISTKSFSAGDIIFREGEERSDIYLIISGNVQLVKTCGNNSTFLETIGKDGVFGEMALIDNSPRSATAIAMNATECYVIDQKIFEDMLESLDPFMRGMIRIIVSRLRSTTSQLAVAKNIMANPKQFATATNISYTC